MDSYFGPLDVVSDDIKKVGGGNAYLGQLRIGKDGKMWELAQMSSGSIAAGDKIILGYKGGDPGKVIAAASGGRCNGVNEGTNTITTGNYFWMQILGKCTGLKSTAAATGSYVCSVGAGLGTAVDGTGGNPALKTAIDSSAGNFIANLTGVIGWALSTTDASFLCDIIIKPNFVWTGSGIGISFDYGDGA